MPPHVPSRLVIHIGDHKTGTTAIQSAFAKGITLEGEKVLYPGKKAHNYLGKTLRKHARKGDAVPLDKIAQLGRTLQASARRKMVSAESLEHLPPERLSWAIDQFFPSDDLRILGYVRPHAGRLLSSYAERTKTGLFLGTFAEFVQQSNASGRLAYAPRFAAWRAQFGAGFRLRPFLRSELAAGSILADVIETGFEVTPTDLPAADTVNTSLCLEDLMRLNMLQSHLQQIDASRRHTLGWEFARRVDLLPPLPTRTPLRLHRDLAETIHDLCIADARALDQSFFDNRPLMQQALEKAVEEAAPEPQSTDPKDYFDASEQRSLKVLAEMIADLARGEDTGWASTMRSRRTVD